MNQLSAEGKKSLLHRFIWGIIIFLVSAIYFVFVVFSDPRHPGINCDETNVGYATFLPIWGNFIFAALCMVTIIAVAFFISRELINAFFPNEDKKFLVWCLYSFMFLCQVIPYIIISLSLYFPKYISKDWNFMTIIFVLSIFVLPILCGLVIYFLFSNIEKLTKKNCLMFSITFVIISIALVGFIYLSIVRTITTIFFFLCIPVFADTGAYFVGVFFGKHKMAPIISPKKTYEGLAGGIVISLGISLLLLFLYSFGERYHMQELVFACQWQYDKNLKPNTVGWWLVISIIIIIAIISAVFGDLMFSLIKRKVGIKDFSTLIKGHGGILDRMDSWILVVFVFFVISIIISLFSTFLNTDNVNRLFNINLLYC